MQIIPEATMEVQRVGYGNPSDVTTIKVPKFTGEVAFLRVEGSVTRNMGDFNSIRIAVMVEMPCYPNAADVDDCYDWCSELVDNKLQRELRVATGQDQEQPEQAAA